MHTHKDSNVPRKNNLSNWVARPPLQAVQIIGVRNHNGRSDAMKLHHLPMIGLGLGFFLVGLSLVWPSLARNAVRSEEEARENLENRARLHSLLEQRDPAANHGNPHAHSHAPATDQGSENGLSAYQAAKQKHEQSDARLQRALFFHSGIASWFRWVGVVLTLAGLAGYYFYSRFALG